MKTLMRKLAKMDFTAKVGKDGDILLHFMAGAIYGNLELYGYFGCGSMLFRATVSTLKGRLKKWLQIHQSRPRRKLKSAPRATR